MHVRVVNAHTLEPSSGVRQQNAWIDIVDRMIVDRESSCDVGCSGVAEAVEQKEIVNHSRYAYRCDIDAGFAEPVCVLFAFVSQDVGFVGDDQRGRKSS